VPHVQRLIDYMEESLVELEDAAGLRTPSGRLKSPRKTAPRAKAGAKAKPKTRPKAKPQTKPKTKTKAKA
jgi:diacylglycerol O-acyltransferase